MTCGVNGCDEASAFKVYAAYEDDTATWVPHPAVRRYPMPMATPCASHLALAMQADQLNPAATPSYVVEVIR